MNNLRMQDFIKVNLIIKQLKRFALQDTKMMTLKGFESYAWQRANLYRMLRDLIGYQRAKDIYQSIYGKNS